MTYGLSTGVTMTYQCLLSMGCDKDEYVACPCPFFQEVEDKVNSKSCRWQDDEGLCCYKADKHDLMKSLSLLCSKAFEMRRRDCLPLDKMTDVCYLLNTARAILDS